jgi:hypothetical protein
LEKCEAELERPSAAAVAASACISMMASACSLVNMTVVAVAFERRLAKMVSTEHAQSILVTDLTLFIH